MAEYQCRLKTQIGSIYLDASQRGLKSISFEKKKVAMVTGLKKDSPENKILNSAVKQLSQYFSGERKKFDLPLDLAGTDFQKKVWRQLSKISFGKTYSYKEIAAQLKNENAFRAVGNANGKNPICIVIPCHRVIAADGSAGGYSGGIKMKLKLLELEAGS